MALTKNDLQEISKIVRSEITITLEKNNEYLFSKLVTKEELQQQLTGFNSNLKDIGSSLMDVFRIEIMKLRFEMDDKYNYLIELIDTKADKSDLNEIKDMVVGIRKELDTEHKVRQLRIEENSKEIVRIKEHIGLEN